MIELFPFQQKAVDEIEQHPAQKIILVAPTGAGKTVIGSSIIKSHQNELCLFVAQRREIIHQTVGKLKRFGVHAGIIMAGEQRPGEYVAVIDGDLAHIERNGNVHAQMYSSDEKQRFYQGLLWLIESRGQKRGAAAHRYKDKFGEWPLRAWSNADPLPPSPEVVAWDRHCRIKFAKSRQAATQAA